MNNIFKNKGNKQYIILNYCFRAHTNTTKSTVFIYSVTADGYKYVDHYERLIRERK